MKFYYSDLETCSGATGMVVAIDVIRAFTNAAIIFSRGAKEIYPVSTVEEALGLKKEIPGSMASGEVGGLPPQGFDFGNSPTQTMKLDLNGKVIIQRTGMGTQGIVRSLNANALLAASFVVAGATQRYIQSYSPDSVTFVITGQTKDERGDEDLACAEYLEALLSNRKLDPSPFMERVFKAPDALLHLDPNQPAFPRSDLDFCTQIDAFDFVMAVTKENHRPVMRAIKP